MDDIDDLGSFLAEANKRPPRSLADPFLYPWRTEVAARFQDLDPNGHVNNVAMAAMFEEARLRFHASFGLPSLIGEGAGLMVASVQLHYLAEAHYPAPVRFSMGVGYLGSSSWRLLAAAHQGELCVALGDATLVHHRAGRPARTPDPIRETLAAHRLIAPRV